MTSVSPINNQTTQRTLPNKQVSFGMNPEHTKNVLALFREVSFNELDKAQAWNWPKPTIQKVIKNFNTCLTNTIKNVYKDYLPDPLKCFVQLRKEMAAWVIDTANKNRGVFPHPTQKDTFWAIRTSKDINSAVDTILVDIPSEEHGYGLPEAIAEGIKKYKPNQIINELSKEKYEGLDPKVTNYTIRELAIRTSKAIDDKNYGSFREAIEDVIENYPKFLEGRQDNLMAFADELHRSLTQWVIDTAQKNNGKFVHPLKKDKSWEISSSKDAVPVVNKLIADAVEDNRMTEIIAEAIKPVELKKLENIKTTEPVTVKPETNVTKTQELTRSTTNAAELEEQIKQEEKNKKVVPKRSVTPKAKKLTGSTTKTTKQKESESKITYKAVPKNTETVTPEEQRSTGSTPEAVKQKEPENKITEEIVPKNTGSATPEEQRSTVSTTEAAKSDKPTKQESPKPTDNAVSKDNKNWLYYGLALLGLGTGAYYFINKNSKKNSEEKSKGAKSSSPAQTTNNNNIIRKYQETQTNKNL